MSTELSEIKNAKELGELLQQMRKEMRVTQKQAADLCNVGPRFIGELEKGKPTAEIAKVIQIIRGYGFRFMICDRKIGRP